MKKIIAYIIIYGIMMIGIALISVFHNFTTSELFILLTVIMITDSIRQGKENEKLKTEIKMLESRIDTLRDRINGTSFDS